MEFHLTPGQTHESTVLDALLVNADEQLVDSNGEQIAWPVALAGDKGYRENWIDKYLLALEITPVIPSKKSDDRDSRLIEFDKELYRRRAIIEQWIGWLKESQRVFSRLEKTAIDFGGFLKIAFMQRYLRLLT